MKKCKRCLIDKSLDQFRLMGKYHQSYCKKCESLNHCEWAKENRKQATETARKYRQANPEQHAEAVKRYNKAHPEKRRKTHNTYIAKRKLKDFNFKLACAVRSRLGTALKDNAKSGSAVTDLGCSIPELKEHIEKQWQEGMSWDNWTLDGWHIDHIKPLASFDLTDLTQFKAAVHYTNLQPLWAEANLSKGKK